MDAQRPKRHRVRLVLAGLAFSLAAASAVTGAVVGRAGSKAPRLAISAESLDLGEGKPKEKLRGALTLTNSGAEPLEFRLTATCGCSELTPREGQIAPSESREIEIALELPGHAPSQQETRVTVLTNDPGQPVAGCHVVARCPPPFSATPQQIDFGELFAEQVAGAQATVEVNDRTGKPLRDPAALHVRRAPSLVQVTTEKGDNGALRLRVTLSSDMRAGDLYDAIEVALDGTEGVVKIPIRARVVAPVSVVPSTVFLRIDPESGTYCHVDLLVISRRSARSGRISLATPLAGVVLEELSSADPLRRRVRLKFTDLTLGERTDVRFTFDGSEHNVIATLVPSTQP